jgi:hypothetical protein
VELGAPEDQYLSDHSLSLSNADDQAQILKHFFPGDIWE